MILKIFTFAAFVSLSALHMQAATLQKLSIDNIEEQAMASLGYKAIQLQNSSIKDSYAMPEPYSSESLLFYKYAGTINTIDKLSDTQLLASSN